MVCMPQTLDCVFGRREYLTYLVVDVYNIYNLKTRNLYFEHQTICTCTIDAKMCQDLNTSTIDFFPICFVMKEISKHASHCKSLFVIF